MMLLSLTCSNPDFKSLNFNKDLSIVVGVSLNKEKRDTTNGVGKSLTLDMIHYMLNAKFKSKNIKNFLEEYGTFKLDFLHNNKNYTVKKNFKEKKWIVNDREYNSNQYKKLLNDIFKDSINLDTISFREAFNCFARRNGYFETLCQQGVSENDYNQRLVNLALLGIDTGLQEQHYQIKTKIDSLKAIQKELKKQESEVPKKNIKDIDDEIKKLEDSLNRFVIAKNYNELKSSADELTDTLNDIRNKIYSLQKLIDLKKINLNSSTNINLDLEAIKDIYNEAKFFFEDRITKRLDEAQNFHNQLVENRKNRLNLEIKDLNENIEKLKIEQKEIEYRRDNILKDLNNSGALEERDSLKDRILTLEKEKKDLEIYITTLEKFQKDEADLNLKIAKIKKEALEYLEKNRDYLNRLENKFRDIVKVFYNNDGGVLQIQTTKSAKSIFNINITIPHDDSDSTSRVKTFCYDMLLYRLNPSMFGFLAHDGELFSEMDKRQKANIFKIIIDEVRNKKLQYFLNIGDSSFREILKDDTGILSSQDKDFIKSKVILEINENPKSWLFGKDFN